MKKLLMVVLFLVGTIASSEALDYKIGPLTFKVPLTNVSTVYLYDFVNDTNLLGGETDVVSFKELTGTIGAVTDVEGQGTPFIGLDYDMPDSFFGQRLRFGAFIGYDWNQEEKRAGIKASMRFWGN